MHLTFCLCCMRSTNGIFSRTGLGQEGQGRDRPGQGHRNTSTLLSLHRQTCLPILALPLLSCLCMPSWPPTPGFLSIHAHAAPGMTLSVLLLPAVARRAIVIIPYLMWRSGMRASSLRLARSASKALKNDHPLCLSPPLLLHRAATWRVTWRVGGRQKPSTGFRRHYSHI